MTPVNSRFRVAGNPRGELALRVWPNGEFGLGRLKTSGEFTPPVRTPSNHLGASEQEYRDWLIANQHKLAGDVRAVLYPGRDMTEEFCSAGLGGEPPLGSSHAVNSHRGGKPRGIGGITSHAKKMLRNGAYLLQRRVSRHRLVMFTGTIPRVSDDVERAVSHAWPEIVRRFQQEVNRLCARAGLSQWTVGCTEVQEARLAEHGGFPLHLHLVFQGRRGKSWAYPPPVYRELWKRILTSCVPVLSCESFSSATRIEAVRKDASSYLAKYASKGLKGDSLAIVGEDYRIPTCWLHMTGGLKLAVKREVGYYVGEVAQSVQWACYHLKQAFHYVGDIKIDTPRGEVSIAWYGKLKGVCPVFPILELVKSDAPILNPAIVSNLHVDKELLAG